MEKIKLDHITKIEGHASLEVEIEGEKVKKVNFEVIEGARFFEGILKGRRYDEVPYLTSRICGICSSIHNICAIQAIEEALNIKVSMQTKLLRELMVIAERIRSHVTHLYFFVLPDYMGFTSAIEMASKHKDMIVHALELIRIGNIMLSSFCGRDMHPISSVIGGFTSFPSKEDIKNMIVELKKRKPFALRTVEIFAKLDYPKFERDTQFICLKHHEKYADIEGEITCIGPKCIPINSYRHHFREYFKDHSTSKYIVAEGKGYCVGSIARINNNREQLDAETKALIAKYSIKFPNKNPFINNYCQALELIYHINRAIQILENLKIKQKEPAKYKIKASQGLSLVEAPRGMLFHEYQLDKNGFVKKANIITPTSQNLRNIEEDIKAFLPTIIHRHKNKVVLEIEKLIRSYDPCISCSAHFLKLKVTKDKKRFI